MKRKPYTPDRIAALPVKRKQYYAPSDLGCPGLVMHVSPGGTKSYKVRYIYADPDKGRLLTYKHLGRYGEIMPRDLDAELAEMRAQAREVLIQARRGTPPPPKRKLKLAGQVSDLFGPLLEAYTREKLNGGKEAKSAVKNERTLKTACREWLTRPIGTISTADVKALTRGIRDGDEGRPGKPYMANLVHALLSHFFRWTVGESVISRSPLEGVEKPWHGEKARAYSWFKNGESEKALKAIWEAASEIGGDGGRYIKFAMLTGKRHEQQIKPMEWSEIDASGFWNVPEKRGNKVKRAHPVPLSALALRVLGPRQASGPVFPTVKDTKALQDRVRKLTGLDGDEPFIWHGLKHLMETGLAKLRVPSDVADMLLDHALRRGTGRIYNHSTALDYRDQTQPAAEAWAGYIAKLVQPAEAVAVLR